MREAKPAGVSRVYSGGWCGRQLPAGESTASGGIVSYCFGQCAAKTVGRTCAELGNRSKQFAQCTYWREFGMTDQLWVGFPELHLNRVSSGYGVLD
jgi:hypothetical protein